MLDHVRLEAHEQAQRAGGHRDPDRPRAVYHCDVRCPVRSRQGSLRGQRVDNRSGAGEAISGQFLQCLMNRSFDFWRHRIAQFGEPSRIAREHLG